MATGDPLVLGSMNDSTKSTSLSTTTFGLEVYARGQALLGTSAAYHGVTGFSHTPADSRLDDAAGVAGGGTRFGVRGTSPTGIGVSGYSVDWLGVVGISYADAGVYGHSEKWTGVVGSTNNPSKNYAGYFWGSVGVNGNLTVWGKKSAAVPFPDGSHRLLYAVESPESWFEDFGTGRLVRGRARVKLDRQFAKIVRLPDYHVFVSPEGDSRGLYVSEKTKKGFEVREQQAGTGSLRFSYRIVARRKDVTAKRFARVAIPKRRDIPKAAEEVILPPVRRRTASARAARKRQRAS